jgi:hypothetical protein
VTTICPVSTFTLAKPQRKTPNSVAIALANRRDQVIGVDDARGQFADVCEQPLQPLAFAQRRSPRACAR